MLCCTDSTSGLGYDKITKKAMLCVAIIIPYNGCVFG